MFKKMIAMFLSVTALMCLAACEPKEAPSESIPPAKISGKTEDFNKKLVPLKDRDGEDVESPYYRIATVDGQLCYEVQVDGEDEPTQVPIDSVIYIVGSPDDCRLEKVSFEYTPEGGETELVEQYRIYATSNGEGATAEDPSGADDEASSVEGEPVSETTKPKDTSAASDGSSAGDESALDETDKEGITQNPAKN